MFIHNCFVVAEAIAILRRREDQVTLQSRQACLRSWDQWKLNSKANHYNLTTYESEFESIKQESKRNNLEFSEPELKLKMRNSFPGDMEIAIVMKLQEMPVNEWCNLLRVYQMDGLVPKAPNKSILYTGGGGSQPRGRPARTLGPCFNCGGAHLVRDCPKPRDQAKFDANLEAYRAKKPKKHGNGQRPKWTQKKKDDHAKNERDQRDAKVLLAAYKASEEKAATPDPESERDARMSEWAGEYKPAQVLAVAGNAATYSIQTPQRLGHAGMDRK